MEVPKSFITVHNNTVLFNENMWASKGKSIMSLQMVEPKHVSTHGHKAKTYIKTGLRQIRSKHNIFHQKDLSATQKCSCCNETCIDILSDHLNINIILHNHETTNGYDSIVARTSNLIRRQDLPTVHILQISQSSGSESTESDTHHILGLPYPKSYSNAYGYACPYCLKLIKGVVGSHRYNRNCS